MIEILPGILEKEWDAIEKKLKIVQPFAKSIHVDFIDGKFAPNETFADPAPFRAYANDFFLEVHMMVHDPLQHVQTWAAAGFKRFIGHIEHMPDQAAFVADTQHLGEVVLAFDGPTSLDALQVPYDQLDGIMCYTSGQVGFSGPPFLPERLEKVRTIRKEHLVLPIEVDGGINDGSIALARDAGATRFVATSFLFNKGNSPQEQYHRLTELLQHT